MYEDIPIQQCADEADAKVAAGAIVFQKWTCRHCQSRQTMTEPNTFFMAGLCEECGQSTQIEKCNYMAITLA